MKKELGRTPFELRDPWLAEPEDKRFVVLDRSRIWSGRRGTIEIELDQGNRVCFKEFQAVRWIDEGFLDRLRDWLGL